MTSVFAVGVLNFANFTRAEEINLVANPSFNPGEGTNTLASYTLDGGAIYRISLADPNVDITGHGVALDSTAARGASVSQNIAIDTKQGRAFCFRFRGLPQDEFTVAEDGLYMRVEFFGDGGRTAYDRKIKPLYPIIEQARQDLGVNGNGHVGGAAVWRDYELTFYVPFPQVDQLKLTVGCTGGMAEPAPGATPATLESTGSRGGRLEHGSGGEPIKRIKTPGHLLLVSGFSLTHLPEPVSPAVKELTSGVHPAPGDLLPLGGRWYYLKKSGEMYPPAIFDHTNAERLFYRDGPDDMPYETPFAGNVSATMRAGNEDLDGNILKGDRLLDDNVTIRFDAGSLVIHTHGVPNHPTGRFPEMWVGPGFNPNSIREQDETYYLPLEPKANPSHLALSESSFVRALNMGPIGVAANGVVFFSPYDADRIDGSNKMDRCCGHPDQGGQYHYHKYPVCLNSPWADEGKGHSPLLGWAFDGFPIYGPYESANVMAKDLTGPKALNTFNFHYDAQRGWHYHVTPGKFPYVIGGYWGAVDQRDIHPPRSRGQSSPGEHFSGDEMPPLPPR